VSNTACIPHLGCGTQPHTLHPALDKTSLQTTCQHCQIGSLQSSLHNNSDDVCTHVQAALHSVCCHRWQKTLPRFDFGMISYKEGESPPSVLQEKGGLYLPLPV
jgi:hypothetical protein